LGKRSLSECDPERVLASLPPDTMDRLADLVVAKLKGTSPCSLLPKQDIVGSNPITRSMKLGNDLHRAGFFYCFALLIGLR
jgi:hypothetical protein